MKKSDYLQKQDKAENPYYYWILEHEAEITDRRALSEEYVVFMQSSGILEQNALSYIQMQIDSYCTKKKENPDFIYTDEDVIQEKAGQEEKRGRKLPWLKPEWSPDTLDSLFYPGGLVIVRRTVAEQVSAETGICYTDCLGEDGICLVSEDYFEYLRECAKKSKNIMHVSRILFHNRKVMRYEYATPRYVGETTGKISAVILSKDNPDMLLSAIQAVKIGGQGAALEIIVVDNGSNAQNREKLEALSEEYGFSYLYHPMAFEYSTLCNLGAREAVGDYLLFLNDDVELVGPIRFVLRMLWEAQKPHVGAVGIKLLYPGGDKIQHVGITDLAVGPSHKLATWPDAVDYDHGRNHLTYNYLAVTGACMMVAKDKFWQVSGFDERLKISYTDVDLCVDLYEKGYYNLVINECFLYHHESISRGNDAADTEKMQRLERERDFFYQKHPFLKESGDPFYHPALTRYQLTYEPEYRQEWEDMTQLALPQEKTQGKWKQTDSEHFCSSIDRIQHIPAGPEIRVPLVEIEGWVIWKKKENLNFDKSLLLIAEGDTAAVMECPVLSKPRQDLEEVFPGEKHILFSGFVCRISEEEYEKNKGRVLAPALTKTSGLGSGTCFYKETSWQIGHEKI